MFTARELATVLAALRDWQQQLARGGLAFADGFPHFVDVDEEPLFGCRDRHPLRSAE